MPDTAPSNRTVTLEWSDFDREPESGIVEGPTPDDIRAIVEHLGRNDEPGGFVVLKRADNDFIQCALQEGGLVVEYHEPDADAHFALDDAPCEPDLALSLFRTWLEDPATIDQHADWTEVDL